MKLTVKFQIVLIITLFNLSLSIAQSNSNDNIQEEDQQVELSKNSIYVDYSLAAFSQLSINYERKLGSIKNITWYGRVGAGYGYIFLAESGYGGLGGLTMLTGKKNHHFEGNLGVFVGHTDNFSELRRSFVASPSQGKTFLMPLIDVGYRYQKPGSGLVFKAKVANIGLGIGVGYAF